MKQASDTSITRISRLLEGLPCTLDELGVLGFEGPDAIAFAQAQLASDVASLAPGDWQWSCLLSAQGRVQAFGPLLHPEPGRLRWVVPAVRIPDLAASLRRYVLRRKLSIDAVALAVAGDAAGTVASPPRSGGPIRHEDDACWIDLGGVCGRGLRLAGSARAPRGDAGAWLALDALDGLPRLLDAAVDAFTAHALGLQRVSAFSTSKGCYPGQEIVARTHFLGRNKRAPRVAWLADGPAPPPPGSRWLAEDAAEVAEALAETVHAARTSAGTVVLVVARGDAPALLRCATSGALGRFESPDDAGAEAAKVL